MRVFAVSDIHIDYHENRRWLSNLSSIDYVDDILILAGDLTDKLSLLEQHFQELSSKFLKVLFVPGNHELWASRDKMINSFEKYELLCKIASAHGIAMKPFHLDSLSIVPLLGWYDFSFGAPTSKLKDTWMDFRACVWPEEFHASDITAFFLQKNNEHLAITNRTLISFSHFLPRIDLMPLYIPESYHYIYPVLGSIMLEKQIRTLTPSIHIYGHSHVNRRVILEGIEYINNAFGYPAEDVIAKKELLCIYEH